MAPSSRQEHPININYLPQLPQAPRSGASSTGTTSPIEGLSSSGSIRFPMPSASASNPMGSAAAGTRMGAGSPSHDFAGRLFSKRAREIQAQEGLTPQMWGPPTSGHSTPLRETIPESPNGESFPDFNQAMPETMSATQTATRRTRAGTLPSRFSPSLASGNAFPMPSSSLIPKTARPTPSTSPFNPTPGTPTDSSGFGVNAKNAAASALLSRLRAGSMPQRPGSFLPPSSSAFGHPLYASGWTSNRDRSSTLQSIQSQPSNGPGSPLQSFTDSDVKTLDYLGLESPQPPRATLAPSDIELLLEGQRNPFNQNLNNTVNRFRSYSVNAKERYADDEDDYDQVYNYSGTNTPANNIQAVQEQIRLHNLEVQAFENFTRAQSAQRPRARAATAGVLDSPSTRMMRNYLPTPSRLDNSLAAADLTDDSEYRLNEAVKNLQLGGQSTGHLDDDAAPQGPTRALWLGNIPASTTVTTLTAIFGKYGSIESARVLTHKNCGFVNFTDTESAVQAKQILNNKEIFPGNGAVRINFAKVPSASATPGHNGLYPSPSPDPHAKAQADGSGLLPNNSKLNGRGENVSSPLKTPELSEIHTEIVQIVKELGATDEEQTRIAGRVQEAMENNSYVDEIPAVEEPSHNRVHDAPKLREIRKRIDNNACSQAEIEEIATNMLPEIAELASDYLGNTVVQKLFEFCSDATKEAMLQKIAPHLATIGVHKNGTWAAQKVIDVARNNPTLQKMIVDAVKPYTVALFYDQFGNYVVQGCLRFGAPHNNFIFEAMLSRLWELAQGRFSARAMRACLESHDATKDQQRMVAAAIALHSVQLATNANGALLLTWFLDTCTFPRRRTVLAPRLVPHIVHLCTHKVAFLTVLKIVNQRNEPEARDTILKALFFSPNDQVLEDILVGDVTSGANLVFKTLTTPHFDEKIRAEVHEHVRNVLLRINASPAQGYKRLMDEVNLPTRGGGSGHRDRSATRPGSSRDSPANSHVDPAGRPMYPHMVPAGYDPVGLQRTGSMDSNGYEQYSMGGGMYVPAMAMGANPQLQYPPQMLAAPRNGQFYPQMNGFQAPVSGMEPYRNVPGVAGPGYGGSPMLQNASLAQGMGPVMGQQMYPYGPYVQQQQPAAGAPRRGRR